MRSREARRIIRYALVGGSTVALDFALYALALALDVPYLAARCAAIALATVFAYTLHRRWTFEAGRHRASLFGRYLTVQVAAVATNLALLTALVETDVAGPLVAQAVVFPVIIAGSFVGQRNWVFAVPGRQPA